MDYKFILYIYIFIFFIFFFRSSKKGTIYLFSPLVIIHSIWIIDNVIPVLIVSSERVISFNIQYVVISTTIINFFYLFTYRRTLAQRISIILPDDIGDYNDKRIILILFFIPFLLLSGILSGVTQGILLGVNVEDIRRTGEIGLGFLREIPQMGIQITLLIYLLQYKKTSYIKVGIYCFCLGVFLFLISGHKAAIVQGALIFIIFFHFKFRGLRWYEYILYLIIVPIAAGFFQVIREGNLDMLWQRILLFAAYPIILYEDTTVPIMNLVEDGRYFYGEEYFAGLVKFIPRFLWENKPLSFDYTLKELVGADFEGGGIYAPTAFSLFINFGYLSPLFYIGWLSLIHYFYSILLDIKANYLNKIAAIFLLVSGSIALTIARFELIILYLIICLFLYKRKRII